jgi:hypothetical protein
MQNHLVQKLTVLVTKIANNNIFFPLESGKSFSLFPTKKEKMRKIKFGIKM